MSDPRPDASRTEPRPEEERGEGLLDWFKAALGLRPAATLREGLQDALKEAETDVASEFSPEERAMLRNILSLRGQRVEDIMIPRADIVAVPLDITLIDLLNLFRTAGHSRLPVYHETLDDPRGMVHIRDFVAWLAARASEGAGRLRETGLALPPGEIQVTLGSVRSLVRNVLFVPPSMPPIDLLVKMQTSRTQLALVIDEYGGTDGLVSIEDIVEIVVGDIEDEHDVGEAAMISTAAGGSFVADARAGLEEVSAAIGVDLVAAAERAEADVDTLGGWLVTLAGRVPIRGEIIGGAAMEGETDEPAEGLGRLEFEILDADPRRVKRVRIHTAGGAGQPGGGRPLELRPSDGRSAPRHERQASETPAVVPASGNAVAEPAAASGDPAP